MEHCQYNDGRRRDLAHRPHPVRHGGASAGTPVRMTIADGGRILEWLTRMVDLTPDEFPMPQGGLAWQPGCRRWASTAPALSGCGIRSSTRCGGSRQARSGVRSPGEPGPYDILRSAVAPPTRCTEPWPRLRPRRCGSDQGTASVQADKACPGRTARTRLPVMRVRQAHHAVSAPSRPCRRCGTPTCVPGYGRTQRPCRPGG